MKQNILTHLVRKTPSSNDIINTKNDNNYESLICVKMSVCVWYGTIRYGTVRYGAVQCVCVSVEVCICYIYVYTYLYLIHEYAVLKHSVFSWLNFLPINIYSICVLRVKKCKRDCSTVSLKTYT